MRTGYFFSASLLSERNGAGHALRLATWPGIGSEIGPGLIADTVCVVRKPRPQPVRPSPHARLAFRGRQNCFNDEVFH
jgi:hypothetical protein